MDNEGWRIQKMTVKNGRYRKMWDTEKWRKKKMAN